MPTSTIGAWVSAFGAVRAARCFAGTLFDAAGVPPEAGSAFAEGAGTASAVLAAAFTGAALRGAAFRGPGFGNGAFTASSADCAGTAAGDTLCATGAGLAAAAGASAATGVAPST